MTNGEKDKGSGGESEVRDVFESIAPVDDEEEITHPHHVSAFEIGSHPIEEDQPVTRQIHLFGPSQLDRAVFCRQLATMIEVGIPLLRALKMLSKRTPHPRLARAIAGVSERVEAGISVSQAFEEHKRVFTPLVCSIIQVGEVGGILEDSLIRLAQIIETKAEMKRKVLSALMYPSVAVAVAFAVIVLILLKAVPVFENVYAGGEASLPWQTQFIITVSGALQAGIWFWVPALVALILFGQWFARTPKGRQVTSFISIRLPVLSRITKKIGVARFSRTMGGLLTAGVPLIESLSIAADTNENTIISNALKRVQKEVERGHRMSQPLAQARIFPPLVVDMVSIGEETGTLDRMLEKIADIYDADVDATLRGLSTIIEPLLIVFLGGVVIFIALAVMLPYFSLVNRL